MSDLMNSEAVKKGIKEMQDRDMAEAMEENRRIASGIENGDTVKVHYVGTFPDGTQFDSSRQEGREPLEFTVGRHSMSPGFENAVKGHAAGDRFTVEIPCDQAYGPVDKNLIFTVPREQVPDSIPCVVGTPIQLSNEQGTMYAVISEVDAVELTLDANNPMAGKDLVFDIEILSVN